MFKLFMWLSILVVFAPSGLVAAGFLYKRLAAAHTERLLELRERELLTKAKEVEFSNKLVGM